MATLAVVGIHEPTTLLLSYRDRFLFHKAEKWSHVERCLLLFILCLRRAIDEYLYPRFFKITFYNV